MTVTKAKQSILDTMEHAGRVRYVGTVRQAKPAMIRSGRMAGTVSAGVRGKVVDVTTNHGRPELTVWVLTTAGYTDGVEEWRILHQGEEPITPRRHLYRFSRPLTKAEHAAFSGKGR